MSIQFSNRIKKSVGSAVQTTLCPEGISHFWSARRVRPTERRGVTLLEVVLAMGLLVVVSTMTYWFYGSSLESSRAGTSEAQKVRLARVVLNRISTEIRQAAGITADNRVGVRGEPERIWLSTYRVPSRAQSEDRELRREPLTGEYDLTKVEYKIVRHPEILDPEEGYEYPLGLARVEIPIPRPDSAERGDTEEGGGDRLNPTDLEEMAARTGIDVNELLEEQRLLDSEEAGDVDLGPDIRWDELYAPELRYLRFCYYDGHQWWDKWDVSGESPLPQLVSITVGFDPHAPFGEEKGLDETNKEYCTCMNEDPVDCEPLADDQYSTVVRLPQSDALFRSRITREAQGLVEELGGADEEETER